MEKKLNSVFYWKKI